MVMDPLRLFFATPPIATREVEIHALGIREWMEPGIVNRPAGTRDHLIMHFHQEVVIGVAGGPREFPPDTLMAWGPRDGHFYGQSARRWCHSWMHCHGLAVARALEAAGVPLATPIVGVEPRILESCVAALHGEIRRHARPDEAIVCAQIEILARELARAARTGEGPAIPARWLELRAHLEACFDQAVSLGTLARRARCSVPHLCSEFKRWFGCSAIDFVIRLRMHRALLLLRNRNLPVAEVAAAVGYEDIHHFSKLFRRRHGASPRAMRERLTTG
jgi:AraC-like DNA-binding protein